MSKVGFILRGSRGSVGDVTLKKGQNGTVMSAKVTKVRNPKTPKQTAQRVIFTLISYAASFLKPLINHSFEGKSGHNENLQQFRKVNLERFRALSAIQYQYDNDPEGQTVRGDIVNSCYTIKGVKTLIPNSYIVSQGSLNYHGNLTASANTDTVDLFFMSRSITSKVTIDENAVKMAVDDFLDVFFGISHRGDQFTVVGVQISSADNLWEYQSGGQDLFKIKRGGRLVRRIVIADNADLDQSITIGTISGGSIGTTTPEALKAALSNVLDWKKTDETLFKQIFSAVSYSYNNGAVGIQPGNIDIEPSDGFDFIKALGVIISHFDYGTWRYSNCVLTTLPADQPDNLGYGLMWSDANEFWERAYTNAPNAAFLDTGEENTTNLDA